MSNTFIYALIDPNTGNIRYIGKSNNPVKRLSGHIAGCKKSPTHKNNWITSLLKENKKPSLKIIDEVPINEWQMWEIFYIEKYRKEGFELTNLSDGGSGPTFQEYYDRAKTIEKMKLRHKLFPNYNRSGNNLKQPIDRDLLYQLYITENLSMPEIAEKLDCSEKKVWDNLQDYEIKKDKRIWKKQCASQSKKVVLQYDLSGNLIKEWSSAVSVYEKLKIKPERCCQGRMKTSKGFIWRYKDEWFDLGLDKLDEHSKKVTQYDLRGNFIRNFDSIKEALESLDSKHVNISSCCLGKSKSAGGYIWRYKGDEPPKKYSNKTIRGVLQYDLLGNLIGEYDSLVDAANKTGSNSNGIQMCCVGKYKHSNSFIWKYK
jgi:predicted DNA-binding protein YlxM (UPF0122 family)